MGPFVDTNQQDIYSGEIFYESQNVKQFVSHEELFQDLINMITNELSRCSNTRVIFVPSHKDMHHISTLPQIPYLSQFFINNPNATLAGNPSIIQLNDFSLGVINTDVLKDIC